MRSLMLIMVLLIAGCLNASRRQGDSEIRPHTTPSNLTMVSVQEGVFDTLFECENMDSLLSFLQDFAYIDFGIARVLINYDGPHAAQDHSFKLDHAEVVSLILLDFHKNYHRVLLHDEFEPGSYLVYFRYPDFQRYIEESQDYPLYILLTIIGNAVEYKKCAIL